MAWNKILQIRYYYVHLLVEVLGAEGVDEGDVDGVTDPGNLTTTEGVVVSTLTEATVSNLTLLFGSSWLLARTVFVLTIAEVCTLGSSLPTPFLFFPALLESPNTLSLGVTTLSTKFDVVNFPPLPLDVVSHVFDVIDGAVTSLFCVNVCNDTTVVAGTSSTTGIGSTVLGLAVPDFALLTDFAVSVTTDNLYNHFCQISYYTVCQV